MTHDPMCVELNAFDNQYGYTTSCKCERLRAFAAKVRMETQLECRPTQREIDDLVASAVADAVNPSIYAVDRYQQGLAAARDAVAAWLEANPVYLEGAQGYHQPEEILAVIDALRGEA